ncbi:GGDEF domain-containing protein [Herbaspirillum sp. DW155]|uniref:GGDEF domain-containing protein n=1 Tax=Herbaspirillum sp. DW155 TaxID=3095609 RepID=UPI0030D200B8
MAWKHVSIGSLGPGYELGLLGGLGAMLAWARVRCRQLHRQLHEARAANDRLRQQALYDDLTGLPNRWLLQQRIARAISRAQRGQACFALLFLDLDDFKSVNDGHGHAAGDLLLMQVAERLGSSLRHADTIARIGGDEFVVLTDIVTSDDIEIIRDKLTRSLEMPFQIGPAALSVSASLGHARYPEDGRSMEELLACADQGMYHLKRARQSQASCNAG